MHAAEFPPSAWARQIPLSEGAFACVPQPLPPDLEFGWDFAARLAEGQRALGELDGIARTLPNPHLLIGPFVRREAVLSSRIEGTRSDLADLVLFEVGGEPRSADAREVANYVIALEYGLARLKQLPLSLRLLRELHGRLMEGARGEHLTPGEFRRSQNWIGPPGSTIQAATYVPPPNPEMHEALNALEKYLHAESPLPPLVRFALVHSQFEAIHPFLDGNGRVGRLLITLQMCDARLLRQPLLYLSAFFERHREDYYRLLLGVSTEGQWEEWIGFFLTGVAEQARDAVWRAGKLLDLWRDYRARLQTARSSALLPRLVDSLFEGPAVTTATVRRHLKITQRAAMMNIRRLEDARVLREVTGKQRYRVWVAPDIIELTNADRPSAT